MNQQVEFARALLLRNEAFPGKWTAIEACNAVSDVHPSIFAKHPKLRNISIVKVCELRLSKDDDVLQSLERLRVTLELSLLEHPWHEDEGFDDTFRSMVTNPDFIFDTRDTIVSHSENIERSREEEQEELFDTQDFFQSDEEPEECDGDPCYNPACVCQDRLKEG